MKTPRNIETIARAITGCSTPVSGAGGCARSIQKLLNWSEADYNANLFDTACAFIHYYFKDHTASEVKAILNSASFWAWYRNQFNQVEEMFLQKFPVSVSPSGDGRGGGATGLSVTLIRQAYHYHHTPEKLEAIPGKMVVYKAMCGVYDQTISNAKP